MRRLALLSSTLVLAAAALVASGAAQARNSGGGSWQWTPPPWYQYTVPFTCGTSGAPTGLVQGVLVIKSNSFLDVSATHFATSPTGGVSQDVQAVSPIAVAPATLSNSITICHIPPGNPGNAHTITIDVAAWPAHQAHGDYQGPCTNGH